MSKSQPRAGHRVAVAEELAGVGDAFEPHELAYLALTTRVENQVRNRLAWRLHQRLAAQGLIAARDWIRSELAILDDGARPLTIVQAAALHDADVQSDRNWDAYAARIGADARKTRKVLGPDGEILLLAVSVAVHGTLDRSLRSLIRHIPLTGESDGPDGRARIAALAARLGELGAVDSFRLGEGKALTLRVRVDGFLVGPL